MDIESTVRAMSAVSPPRHSPHQRGHPMVLTNSVFQGSIRWLDCCRSIYPLERNSPEPTRWSPWREAVALYRTSRRFDVVLTLGGRTALLYGTLCLLTRRPARQIIAEFLMDEPRPRSPIWRCKQWMYRRIARHSLGVISGSTAEAEALAVRLDIDAAVIRVVPAHPTVTPRHTPDHQGYVLAAGRSLRDYDTLVLAAPRISAPIHVVCGKHDLVTANLPDNMRVRREVSRDEYLSLLDRCRVVVVPLKPAGRVSGQVALLDAMARGKPVVASLVTGTTDIVRSEWNAIGVPAGDAKALADAVNRLLNDDALAAAMGSNAYGDVLDAYADGHCADRMLEAVEELSNGGGGGDR